MAEQLRQLWAELPPMQCQGACFDACHSWGMTPPEQALIRARGVDMPLIGAQQRCPALTAFNQCAVYDVRPTICRVWGMTRQLMCNYGCRPEGGWLTGAQADEFLARAAEIAGMHEHAAFMRHRAATVSERDRVRAANQADLAYAERERRARADGTALYPTAWGLRAGPRPGHG